ncbi:hypothetical protein ACFQ1Q_00970 [Winogradskyella litorisediminis]|uniref:Uncharacterized protein n=1 Tax=Winogradskyella litorisediminis TaxID=1156618 RepID=A0ABW3N3A0_9FLAO
MKFKLLAIALATLVGVQAQTNPRDKKVETTVRTIKVTDNGKTVERKIMVRTSESQEVMTNPAKKGTIDADRVFPPTKVETVIYIDNDDDPFYDGNSEIAYYEKDGMRFDFKMTNSGFNFMNSNSDMKGRARITNNSDVYLINTDSYSGIGYFEGDSFVVEYYDEDGVLTIERFNRTK